MPGRTPVEDREYRIIPANQSWNVRGKEASEYYEKFDELEVGQQYSNSAYTIVRTSNRKHKKRGLRGLFRRRH